MTKADGKVLIYEDIAGVSRAAAEIFLGLSVREAGRKGFFTAVLSGGRTPSVLYSMLAGDEFGGRVPWKAVHLFWGDERCVGRDDPMSNYKNASDLLISKVDILPGNVHRIRAELPPDGAALEYEREIRFFFGSMKKGGGLSGAAREGAVRGDATPAFDLVFLGLGADGHTLSIFPSTGALLEKERMVVDNYVEGLGSSRITMTLPLINNASCVVFLVSGKDKAGALKEVLSGGGGLPAQMVRPAKGELLWLVDREAASLLS
ncbi:MAG: 6-phosphogluconolactonase [Deltaproteobacteria bacterium]|nr:6-phosphogluconolactonase [Deltaproteobacteria bacterium]